MYCPDENNLMKASWEATIWPSLVRIKQLDVKYGSLSTLHGDVRDIIMEKLGCADYFATKRTSSLFNKENDQHPCERAREHAATAFEHIKASGYDVTIIDKAFIENLNQRFLERLGGGSTMSEHPLTGVLGELGFFSVLQIVAVSKPMLLTETSKFALDKLTIAEEEMKAFWDEMVEHPIFTLTELSIIHTHIGGDWTVRPFCKAIEKLSNLQTLTLYDASLGSEFINFFSEDTIIKGGLRNVRELSLRSNNLSGAFFTCFTKREVIENPLTNLRKLDLARNNITGTEDMYRGLYQMSELTDLDLSFNPLFEDTGIGLLLELTHGPTHPSRPLTKLRSLNLMSAGIGVEGMRKFSTALENGALESLEYLYIGMNKIRGDGMKALSNALCNGAVPSLKELHVNHCSIYPKQVIEEFARAIEENKKSETPRDWTKLKKFNYSFNCEATRAIKDALPYTILKF